MGRLPALTGIRFWAALAVVLFHAEGVLAPRLPGFAGNLVRNGSVGVSLFFVLSGFVLAYNYLGRGHLDRRGFWIARIARIYPIYLLALLAALWLGRHSGDHTKAFLLSLAMLQAWLPDTALALNPPSWSLSAEACFYALFPFLAPALWRLHGRRLLAGWVVAAVAGVAVPVAYALGSGIYSASAMTPLRTVMLFLPALHITEFAMGVLAARAYRDGVLARQGAVVSMVSAAAIVALLGLVYIGRSPLLNSGGLAVPFALLVLGLAIGGGPLNRLLSGRVAVLLGEASYSIYILQWPLMNALIGVRKRIPMSDLQFFAIHVGGLILLSIAAYLLVETPARRLIRGALSRTGARVASRPAAPRPEPDARSAPETATAGRPSADLT